MKLQLATLVGALASCISLSAGAVQFAGTGVGPIPDGAVGGTVCGDFGPPLVISFNVSGLTDPISTLGVRLDATHTWVGDLTVRLTAPDGTTNLALFGATGSTGATACGDSSNLGGVYNFGDGATGGWWTAAAAVGDGVSIAPGDYRTSAVGGTAGATGPATSLVNVFGGMPAAAANGIWTLTVQDGGEGDLGTINAATLFIAEPVPVSLQEFGID